MNEQSQEVVTNAAEWFTPEAKETIEQHQQEATRIHFANKRKKERIDNDWSTEKKIATCGKKIGEYFDGKKHVPYYYHCLQCECKNCTQYKAEEDRRAIERAANEFANENPSAKLYHAKNITIEESDGSKPVAAMLKRIKRGGGVHRRCDNGDGTCDVFFMAENEEPFAEIEPILFYENDQPYESYNLVEMTEYFEHQVERNRTNDKRWSGKLKKDATQLEERDLRVRYDIISPSSKDNWTAKKNVDKEVSTLHDSDGNIKEESDVIVPLSKVADIEEYQTELDKLSQQYIQRYLDEGIEFTKHTTFRHVNSKRAIEEWNHTAALNRTLLGVTLNGVCTNKVLEVNEGDSTLAPYMDICGAYAPTENVLAQIPLEFAQNVGGAI